MEPDRYRLIAARACPWANRAIIVRRLLGLEDVISMGLCGPTHDKDSWTFDLDPREVDPVLGIHRLQDAYFKRDPDYSRGITVPAMVDIPTGQVVTNDFPQITQDLFFEWRDHHRPDAPNLWPDECREEMEAVMERVFTEVNNGVYRCGFAGSQEAYDEAYDRLWTAMDWLEERLGDRRYLMGDAITEADIRLFTTLARFDAVYHGHFKCNRNKLVEMPNLWGYARDLFQTPGFGETIDFEQIKQHYYVVQSDVNPSGIVPKGPDHHGWLSPRPRGDLTLPVANTRLVPVPGGAVEVEVRGDGEPVVLIQTALVADELRPLGELLLRDGDRQVIGYHRRGYGRSTPARGPGSITSDALDSTSFSASSASTGPRSSGCRTALPLPFSLRPSSRTACTVSASSNRLRVTCPARPGSWPRTPSSRRTTGATARQLLSSASWCSSRDPGGDTTSNSTSRGRSPRSSAMPPPSSSLTRRPWWPGGSGQRALPASRSPSSTWGAPRADRGSRRCASASSNGCRRPTTWSWMARTTRSC